jgi:CRP-like cAMP-binding protein
MRTDDRQNILNLLRRGQWFGELPEDLQTLLLDNSMLRLAEEGQVLIAEETHPTGMFALLDGQIAITRQIADKGDFFYHLGGPGFWFGESGLLNREYTNITATARTKVRTLFLPASSFEQIIDSEPRYYRLINKLVLARYAIIMRNLGQSNSFSPEEYLRIRLADLSDMIHSEGFSSETVELALSQADLAAMIGSSRQTINMLLKKLEAQRLIEVNFRKIRILDPSGLRGEHRKTGL